MTITEYLGVAFIVIILGFFGYLIVNAKDRVDPYNDGYGAAVLDIENSGREICVENGGVPIMGWHRKGGRELIKLENCIIK